MVKYKMDFQIIWIPKSNANIFKNTILVKKKKKKKRQKHNFAHIVFNLNSKKTNYRNSACDCFSNFSTGDCEENKT